MKKFIKIERMSKVEINCDYYGWAYLTYSDYYYSETLNKDESIDLFKDDIKKSLNKLSNTIDSNLKTVVNSNYLSKKIKSNKLKLRNLKSDLKKLKAANKIVSSNDILNKIKGVEYEISLLELEIVDLDKKINDSYENITFNNDFIENFDYDNFNYESKILTNDEINKLIDELNYDFKNINFDSLFKNTYLSNLFCSYLEKLGWIRLSSNVKSINEESFFDEVDLYRACDIEDDNFDQ